MKSSRSNCWSVVDSKPWTSLAHLHHPTPTRRPMLLPLKPASAPGICRLGFRNHGSASCSGDALQG